MSRTKGAWFGRTLQGYSYVIFSTHHLFTYALLVFVNRQSKAVYLQFTHIFIQPAVCRLVD